MIFAGSTFFFSSDVAFARPFYFLEPFAFLGGAGLICISFIFLVASSSWSGIVFIPVLLIHTHFLLSFRIHAPYFTM